MSFVKKIFEENEKKFILFDSAMGTTLQKMGLKAGEIPELFNFTHSDIILDIHKQNIEAGSDIIITNTFGANEINFENGGIIDKMTFSPESVKPISEVVEAMRGEDIVEVDDQIFEQKILENLGENVYYEKLPLSKRILGFFRSFFDTISTRSMFLS